MVAIIRPHRITTLINDNKPENLPPLSEIPNLRQPLTEGETALVRQLNAVLPIAWEIYIQPHLNGLCPDILVLNPFVGVIVFEVKDWDFGAMNYHWEPTTNSRIRKLLATNKDGKTFKVENPIEKAKLYSSEILNLYCPSVGISFDNTPVVSSVVFFSKLTTDSAKNFTKEAFRNSGVSDDIIDRYYPSIGHDALNGNLEELIPFLKFRSSKYMREEYACDLRFWLEEPRAKKDQRTPVTLSPGQQKLIGRERTKNGFRRIRGSAGAGKSLVLASKAANLAIQGQKIMVVSFNITLGNYLGDLVARAALPTHNVRNKVDFLNYHMWARRVCTATGNEDQYHGLEWDKDLDEVLSHSLPELVDSILQDSSPEQLKYDAVLVDEGQDFQLLWWQSLTRIVKDSGEAILVADKTQDLYKSASAWTDEAMTSAGFRGPWNELKVSYRLPIDYLPYIRDFLQRFIPNELRIVPEAPQYGLPVTLTHMRWIQVVDAEASIQTCVDAVLEFPIRKRADDDATYPDVVVLAETIESGFQIQRNLGSKGVKVRHTFGLKSGKSQNELIRKQKVAFFLGAEQVKATTIHSYKGWESTCLIIQLVEGTSRSAIAAAYTALTRLKASERGEDSYITVVCSAKLFEEYGKTWPNFEYS